MPAITTSTTVERDLLSGRAVKVTGYMSIHRTSLLRIEYRRKAGYVDLRLFVGDKSKALAELLRQGVVITSNADWQEIVKLIEEVPGFAPAPLIEGPGWTGPYFADKNGKVYSPKGVAKGIAIFRRRDAPKLSRGTHKTWLTQVAIPITGQDLPILAVLMALAAPLLEIIGEPQNMGFEFCGPPGTGKTTCLRLMASIAGDPSVIPNFNATQVGIEDMFPDHNGLPFAVDEANLVSRSDGQFLKDFAFRMANGTTRVTRFQSSHARSHFVFATTANDPFHTGLRQFNADTADAALQRLIPLQVHRDNPFGVFNRIGTGFTTSGEMAQHLSQAIGRQFGTPMRRMLHALVKLRAADSEGLKGDLQRRVRAFDERVGIAGTARGISRVTSAFGLLYAAGEFAKAMRILPQEWDCMAACVAGYRNYQEQLPHHTPLATRLLTLAQREVTLDLRNIDPPRLTDDQVERHGAFLKIGVRGRIELLITEATKRQFFSDWSSLQLTDAFRLANLRDTEHATKQRQVRRGRRKERFYCFILPGEMLPVAGTTGPHERSVQAVVTVHPAS